MSTAKPLPSSDVVETAPWRGSAPRRGLNRRAPIWLTAYRLGVVVDVIGVLLLLGAAYALVRSYLHSSLFVWGDHPGQFMRFWYSFTQAAPAAGHGLWGILSWNPTWYAGYPELQFYPPGTSLTGVLIHYLTLGLLSLEQVYNLIVALAFCLPLFTCYAFLRATLAPLGQLPSILAGLTAGFLGVTLKPMWGGVDAVVIGLLGERLAFGFAPLVLWAGWRLIEQPSRRRLAVAAGALACLLLLHPFHAPAVVGMVALYALARRDLREATRPAWRGLIIQGVWLVGWLVAAVGLISWWLLPLVAHYRPYAACMLRATPQQVMTWFTAHSLEWLLVTAPLALLLLAFRSPRVQATVGVLACTLPLLAGAILIDAWVLVARYHITVFDPIRFMAEYYLALILLVGCVVGMLAARFLWQMPWLAAILTPVVLFTLQPYLGDGWDQLREKTVVKPGWRLSGMNQHPALTGYWEALRTDQTPGRVLVISNYLFLDEGDGTVTPTTLHSLIPYLTGREIVGGTFSHWSPVARWLWVGDPYVGQLPERVEQHGSHTLFGKPWAEIHPDELVDALRRLNVTTLVAGRGDEDARHVLDTLPTVSLYWRNEYFSIYHLHTDDGAWVTSPDAQAQVVERTPRRWLIQVQASAPAPRVLLKMGHYPLWRARIGNQPLPVAATPQGLQEIVLPEGGPYLLEVVYQEGMIEWSGLIVSLLMLGLTGACLLPLRAAHLRTFVATLRHARTPVP